MNQLSVVWHNQLHQKTSSNATLRRLVTTSANNTLHQLHSPSFALCAYQVIMAAKQVSPPFFCQSIQATAVSVEYLDKEYILPWTDILRSPDLENFGSLENTVCIEHSPQMEHLWKTSSFINYGVYAQVRQLNTCDDGFPMIKMASQHVNAREYIQTEFQLLRMISTKDLPIVKVYSEPLTDEQGIFGFRMERLDCIPAKKLRNYLPHIENAVDQLHKAGIVHGDISIGNIMANEGEIRIIDFGLSGIVGEEIPSHHLQRIMTGLEEFSTSTDLEKLRRIRSIAQAQWYVYDFKFLTNINKSQSSTLLRR